MAAKGTAEIINIGDSVDKEDSEVLVILRSLQKGQEDLKVSLSNQIQELKTELIDMIDDKLKRLKESVDREMTSMVDNIASVTVRVAELEKNKNTALKHSDDIRREHMVDIKNLPSTPNENPDILLQLVRSMVTTMELDPDTVIATRAERAKNGVGYV